MKIDLGNGLAPVSCQGIIKTNTDLLWIEPFTTNFTENVIEFKFLHQSGTKPNLVAKILATKFGVFHVIYVML